MSLSAALLGLADDLNTHLGAQHDLGKLRQQHEHKLVQHQQQRQHKQVQQQQQRKRYREEQERHQQLQYNKPATTLSSPTATTRVQLRGAWSSTETALLHSLIRSTARRHQGYSTDSDDDSSDTEQTPTAEHSSAELQFDEYCAIARRMRRPVQEVMTFSAPINSPLAAFLRSSASENSMPDGVAQYTEFVAQQFDRSLGLGADRQWRREKEQERQDEQVTAKRDRWKQEEEEDEARVEQEEEEEEEEAEQEENGEAEQASHANGMESEEADSEQFVRAVRKSTAFEDDYSDDSDSDASYRNGDEQDEEDEHDDEDEHEDEDEEDASDDSSERSETDNEDSEDGSEDASVVEASSESDQPLSTRMKQAAKQMRRR